MANFGACRCWCADRKSHRRGNEGQPERSMGVPWVQEDPEYLRIGEEGQFYLHSSFHLTDRRNLGNVAGYTEFQTGLTCLLINHSVFMLIKSYF